MRFARHLIYHSSSAALLVRCYQYNHRLQAITEMAFHDDSLVKTAARLHFRKRPHDDDYSSSEFLMPPEFPDKSLFSIIHTYPALSVPKLMTANLRVELKHLLFQKARTKNVYTDPRNENEKRLIILQYPAKNGFPITNISECQEVLNSDPVLSSLMQSTATNSQDGKENDNIHWFQNVDGSFGYKVERCYDQMTADEVFQKFFDNEIMLIPSSFEIIGQIAHLNLRVEQLPYKFWIGSILLEKNKPAIRTIVNKIGSIDTTFRTFPMEVVAGYGYDENKESDWSVTTQKEEGCSFQLDFRTVYWNSRLSGEHKRLVNLIKEDASTRKQNPSEAENSSSDMELKRATVVVADLMAGVGPFAVPLTSSQLLKTIRESNKTKIHDKQSSRSKITLTAPTISNIIVHANDLNPESFKYLQINCKLNNCSELYCYNEDARVFLWELQNKILSTQNSNDVDHVIMNLPASAPEFLDAFRGWSLVKLPRIHVHCFAPKPRYMQSSELATTKSDESKGDAPIGTDDDSNHISNLQQTYQVAVDRCSIALGCAIDWNKDSIDVHLVRDVSPGKNMLCVSFNLPDEARRLTRIELETTISGDQADLVVQDNLI